MDLNLFVLRGTIAAEPDLRRFDSGASLIRYLVTTHSTVPRRRIDVLPVTVWDPGDHLSGLGRGDRICAVGSAQRRFWDSDGGRRSRLELTVQHLEPHAWDPEQPTDSE